MRDYWRQTSLRLSADCWERLRLFSAVLACNTSVVAAQAIEWATERVLAGKWEELARHSRMTRTHGIHQTSFRLSPELKEVLRDCAAGQEISLVDFVQTAIWAYTSGIDAVAEKRFRDSVLFVAAERCALRQDQTDKPPTSSDVCGEANEN